MSIHHKQVNGYCARGLCPRRQPRGVVDTSDRRAREDAPVVTVVQAASEKRLRPRSWPVAGWVALLATAAHAGNPAVLERLTPGQWLELPDTKLIDAAPRTSPGGSTLKVVTWSGGAYDSRHDAVLVWGGGHSDYAGNEVYVFDLGTQRWQRLTEPSVADRARTPAYPDGQPRARHTYNYLEYVPSIERLLCFGASGPWPGGGGEFSREVLEFDVDKRRWTSGTRADVPPSSGTLIGAQARLDPVSGRIFVIGSQRAALQAYDPGTNRWSSGWTPVRVRVHATAAIDPVRREFMLIGSGGKAGAQALRWHLDRPGDAEDLASRTSGDKQIQAAYAPGFDYDAVAGQLVAWSGGTDIFVFDADETRWTRLPAATGNTVDPGPANPTGTFGRFRYAARHDAFVLVNRADQNVFMYRPARRSVPIIPR